MPPPPVDPARDHLRGDGPRTLLLYGDYEDPRSRDAYRTIQALEASRTPFVLAFRHLPLTDLHPHALQAAVAAEAAHDQGRFWDMHDILFTGQEHLGRQNLREYAEALGLDLERFNREFASDEQLARITTDVRGALEAGVRGTPALFVDGSPQRGYDVDELVAAVTG
jgi:protein-disulfide isomerase